MKQQSHQPQQLDVMSFGDSVGAHVSSSSSSSAAYGAYGAAGYGEANRMKGPPGGGKERGGNIRKSFAGAGEEGGGGGGHGSDEKNMMGRKARHAYRKTMKSFVKDANKVMD